MVKFDSYAMPRYEYSYIM